jgi:hypothetical protein
MTVEPCFVLLAPRPSHVRTCHSLEKVFRLPAYIGVPLAHVYPAGNAQNHATALRIDGLPHDLIVVLH